MATYNCSDSSINSYGAGSYGTCSSKTVGAPNTGLFWQSVDNAGFTLVAPLAFAIVIVVIASVVTKIRRNKKSTNPTAE